MDVKRRIEEIVEEELQEEFFLVDVIITGSRKSNVTQTANAKILVLIDGDNGITIDTCAEISRKLGETIETENLFESAYLLEVSSPGLDYPLKLKRQYEKNKGRKVKVLANDDQLREGELLEVTDDKILIREETREKGKKKIELKEVEISFSDIKKTNVVISFR